MTKRRITTDGEVFRVEQFQEPSADFFSWLLGERGYWAIVEISYNNWALFNTRREAEAFLDRANARHSWTEA